MAATIRAPLIVIMVLSASAVRAQTTMIAPEERARHLVSATKSGQEGAATCDDLDAAVGKALIGFGDQTRAASLDRVAVAYRLAERTGRCLGSESLVGSAL